MKDSISFNNFLQKVFIICFWLLLWQIAAVVINQPLYLPSPFAVLQSLYGMVFETDFWRSIFSTFYRVALGLLCSVFLGILLGFAAARSRLLYSLFEPLITTAKSIPLMSIIILALVWLKASNVPIFVCVLLCFPIMYTNVVEGIHSIDPNLIEMARVFKIKKKRVFFDIVLPSIRSYIFSGIMICVGFSWKSVVTAEVLSSPKYALGYKLYTTKLYLDTPALFAWTVTIVLISIFIERVIKKGFQQRFSPGKEPA